MSLEELTIDMEMAFNDFSPSILTAPSSNRQLAFCQLYPFKSKIFHIVKIQKTDLISITPEDF
jgi:hypothetical protein